MFRSWIREVKYWQVLPKSQISDSISSDIRALTLPSRVLSKPDNFGLIWSLVSNLSFKDSFEICYGTWKLVLKFCRDSHISAIYYMFINIILRQKSSCLSITRWRTNPSIFKFIQVHEQVPDISVRRTRVWGPYLRVLVCIVWGLLL